MSVRVVSALGTPHPHLAAELSPKRLDVRPMDGLRQRKEKVGVKEGCERIVMVLSLYLAGKVTSIQIDSYTMVDLLYRMQCRVISSAAVSTLERAKKIGGAPGSEGHVHSEASEEPRERARQVLNAECEEI
jgi:hypothetical protein